MTTEISAMVHSTLGQPVTTVDELDGGMIGDVFRVTLADGSVIVAKTSVQPLSVEAEMLAFISEQSELPVPEVYSADDDLLCLEYVPGDSTITPAVESDAAEHLAALHENHASSCGFPFDTLCGPVEQPNPWTDSWIEFYREYRIEPVVERASAAGTLSPAIESRIRDVCTGFEEILRDPDEPALLHGDVWQTNILTDGERITAFLDPACYFGHPEIELAYIDWTDTFGERFFERYQTERGIGLDDDFFECRRFAYRLYPLIIHIHLFGNEYRDSLLDTLSNLE
ncbi:fructosamine kinase [Halobacteriales archaeon QS_4_62_28]|nr:MAG: fructosamine kinase [Halobacteriales archaeon QS_4_62_28]